MIFRLRCGTRCKNVARKKKNDKRENKKRTTGTRVNTRAVNARDRVRVVDCIIRRQENRKKKKILITKV